MSNENSVGQSRRPTRPGISRRLWRSTKRVVLGLVGSTVILVGVALLVLPGPGLLIIAAGLGILALEFAWASRLLRKGRGLADKAMNGPKRKAKRKNKALDPTDSAK